MMASPNEPRSSERGATLVEFALVLPILLLLVLGLVDIAALWGNSQSVVQAARSGARSVSHAGQLEEADQISLRSVKATLGSDWTDIERVVIYEASSADQGNPPAGCIADGVTSSPTGTNCNVYTSADLGDVLNDARFVDGANCGTARSSNWCPSLRNNDLRTAQWIGVWVEYKKDWLTGFLPLGAYTITENTVMRMEPRV